MEIGPHLARTGPHPKKRFRIDCEVSEEVFLMWKELTEVDRKRSKERYYPAHTLARLVKADYKIMKTFGV